MKFSLPSRNLRQAFSLVEMLVVVAILGVLAGIAIGNMGKVTDGAKLASSQRNAQHVVSIFESGAAAGIIWTGTDRNGKVASVVTGSAAPDGAFVGKYFQVPNLGGADLTNTYPFIGIDASGDLFYDEAGTQSPT